VILGQIWFAIMLESLQKTLFISFFEKKQISSFEKVLKTYKYQNICKLAQILDFLGWSRKTLGYFCHTINSKNGKNKKRLKKDFTFHPFSHCPEVQLS